MDQQFNPTGSPRTAQDSQLQQRRIRGGVSMSSADQSLVLGMLIAAILVNLWRAVLFVVVVVTLGVLFAGILWILTATNGQSLGG